MSAYQNYFCAFEWSDIDAEIRICHDNVLENDLLKNIFFRAYIFYWSKAVLYWILICELLDYPNIRLVINTSSKCKFGMRSPEK